MRTNVIGGEGLTSRGVTNSLGVLRPILADNATITDMFTTNATLRKDEWERIDERVNEVLRERLTVADDLRSRGLITPVSLGTILRVTERSDQMDAAELTFDGDTAPPRDRPAFLRDTIPVPVLSKDFTIGWRQLDASRTRGEPLDTTAAEQATRKVRDRLQSVITNGYGAGPAGNVIPGLTTAANRQTIDLVSVWDGSGADPIADVVAMLEAAYAVNLSGPFVLYLPKNYWALVQQDYNTQKGDRTFLERMQAFADVDAVRPLDALADDNVTLVQMTRDTLDLSEAAAITTVQWEKNPWTTNFRVMMVGGPQIKNMQTDTGTTVHGIIHLRPAP